MKHPKKIAIVIGGRPQIIKASVLAKTFIKSGKANFFIINSGQHYSKELSENLFNELKINKPKYNIYSKSHSPLQQIAKIMVKIENILIDETPDLVILFGDMNTTLAAAITARKLNIQIMHIEAGIRSGNLEMSEEQNRIITDHISTTLVATDQNSKNSLQKEGIGINHMKKNKIFITGDLMLEAMRDVIPITEPVGQTENFALLTIHRAENTCDIKKLEQLLKFVKIKSQKYDKIVFPVHPRTKKLLQAIKLDEKFMIIKPVGYKLILKLCSRSKIVFTDSGGLQREACWLGKPCVILRDQTEWPELVKSKRAVLFKHFTTNFKFKTKQETLKTKPSLKILKVILDN